MNCFCLPTRITISEAISLRLPPAVEIVILVSPALPDIGVTVTPSGTVAASTDQSVIALIVIVAEPPCSGITIVDLSSFIEPRSPESSSTQLTDIATTARKEATIFLSFILIFN